MYTTRGLILGIVGGLVAGILIIVGAVQIGLLGSGSNPGLGASRGGAEILLDTVGNACSLADKTRSIRVRDGYQIVWNIKNRCASGNPKGVALRIAGPEVIITDPAQPVPPGSVGVIRARVDVTDWRDGERRRTVRYEVTVDGQTIDPDIIIDRY